jgi:hypothetical protein
MTVKLSINNIKNTAFLFSRYKLYIDFIERLYLYNIVSSLTWVWIKLTWLHTIIAMTTPLFSCTKVLTKGSNNNNNNSLLDKAQQITMRNPCSHTMTILYQYSLCKKTIQVYIDWEKYIDQGRSPRSIYFSRSIYNLYRLLTKAISVILLIWLVDQEYFTKWIRRALNVYFFPQIHIACTCICEHPWWHQYDHLTFFLICFPWLLKEIIICSEN